MDIDYVEKIEQETKLALKRQDEQANLIMRTEREHKGDTEYLISFWENLWATDGLLFNGVYWTFRLVELYYKEGRFDDAWRFLSRRTLDRPNYLNNIRRWQLKILKKEKRDTSAIEELIRNGK